MNIWPYYICRNCQGIVSPPSPSPARPTSSASHYRRRLQLSKAICRLHQSGPSALSTRLHRVVRSAPTIQEDEATRRYEQANSLTRISRYDDNGGDDDFGGARSLQLHINVYTYIYVPTRSCGLLCTASSFFTADCAPLGWKAQSFTSHGARDEHTATNKGLRVNNLGT